MSLEDDHTQRCDSVLETDDGGSATEPDSHDEPSSLITAGRLNHYLLIQKLGQGGMGVVYAAYDEKLDRKVAIKLLRTEGDRKARRRLVREAQSMARLSHPNVVQIYEIGEADSLIFIVMEFVRGRTLKRWLSEQPRSRAEILASFAAAGEGLAAAHAEGLVHRDFKPDNVMIRDDGRVQVMDFGLAHVDAEQSEREQTESGVGPSVVAEPSGLTATGVLMGTPAYMAPEQFEGAPTDARTDQFSFCVALWEAVHGKRPFGGASLMELSASVCSGRVTVPEHSDVPSWLRRILERGLAVDPAQRWPSQRALLDALRKDPTQRRRGLVLAVAGLIATFGLIGGSQLIHRRELDEQREGCRAEAAALGWSDAIAADLQASFEATGLAYASSTWTHTRAELERWAGRWSEAREQACVEARVEHSTDVATYATIAACLDEQRASFSGLLEAWAELDEQGLARATSAAVQLPPVSACTTELRVADRMQPPAQLADEVARIREALEHALGQDFAGEFDAGLARGHELLAEAEQLGWRPLIAEARVFVARMQLRTGSYVEARATAEQAYVDAVAIGHDMAAFNAATHLTKLVGDELSQPELGRFWGEVGRGYIDRMDLAGGAREAALLANIGSVLVREAKFDEALVVHERVLAISRTTFGPEHVRVASALTSVGTTHWEKGDYAAALVYFNDALRIQKLTLGDVHPSIALTINNIGAVHWGQGNYDDALSSFRTVLELREAALGPRHPDVAAAYNNLGAALAALGRPAESLEAFTHAYEIQVETVGLDHPDLAGSLMNMANILREQGRFDESLATHQRALAIAEAALGREHPQVGMAYNNIGVAQAALGRHDEALVSHRQALAVREAAFGLEHADVAMSHDNIGSVLMSLGRLDEARVALERALAIREATLGPEHVKVASSCDELAEVLRRLGRLDAALEVATRGLAIREAALGAEHSDLAFSLTELGELHLRRRELEPARAALERALALRTAHASPPAELALTQFSLARVIWALGERERASELAGLARGSYVELGESAELELGELDAWLAEHR